jgi:hypothetical protein
VFLLLLCNDKAVLGTWTNGRRLNALTGMIIWVLVILSVILTASVLFPAISSSQIIGVFALGATLGVGVGVVLLLQARRRSDDTTVADALAETRSRETWRMPPLALLERPTMSLQRKVGLATLRAYLVVALVLVVVKIVEVALH